MEWIDLSLPIKTGMPVYPGDPPVFIEIVLQRIDSGPQLSNISMGSHSGTHIDAPRHFLTGEAAVDQLPLDRFFATAFVAGLPYSKDKPLDLTQMNIEGMQPGDALLLATGWDSRADSPDYFSDVPRFAPGSIEWLLDKNVKMFGVDLPTVIEGHEPHQIASMHVGVLRAGVVLVENLCKLVPLIGKRLEFQALPLRLVGCDGSPVRAIGRVVE